MHSLKVPNIPISKEQLFITSDFLDQIGWKNSKIEAYQHLMEKTSENSVNEMFALCCDLVKILSNMYRHF